MRFRKHNILVVGADGMLGSEVYQYLTTLSQLEDSSINAVWKASHSELPLENYGKVLAFFDREKNNRKKLPDIVINCAAFTDTTACETPAGYIPSYQANALGPKHLAEACAASGIKLIHISTDYVYSHYQDVANGFEEPFPSNIYGLHKLLGEKFVESAYVHAPTKFLILRTSWLFGPSKTCKTFVHKVICNAIKSVAQFKLYEKQGKPLPTPVPTVSAVDNCFGRPTSVWYLSSCIANAIDVKLYGTIDMQQTYDHQFLDREPTDVVRADSPVSRFVWADEIINYAKQFCPALKPLILESAIAPLGKVAGTAVIHPCFVPPIQNNGPNASSKIAAVKGLTVFQKSRDAVNDTKELIKRDWKQIFDKALSKLTEDELQAFNELQAAPDPATPTVDPA